MELRPFRAMRYDTARVDLVSVVAPPYDVIDDRHREALYSRNPHNVVRLILNRDADRYTSSAQHLRQWIDAGILRQDAEPALWLYVQNFAYGESHFERTGLIGAVRLEPFSSGRIRPHERTLSAPREDRMRLLQACRVNLSPIFGLCVDQSRTLAHLRAEVEARPPTDDLTDEFSVRHRTWQLTDGAQTARITAALAAETIFIADGHHRYETALAYRDQLQRSGGLADNHPAHYIMMSLCSMDDPGLLVLPTHRVLRGVSHMDAASFRAAVQDSFRVQTFPNSAAGRRDLLAALAKSAVRGCFGVALRGADVFFQISPRDDVPSAIDAKAAELPPEVRHLDVTILDRLILRGVLGIEADVAARAGQLRYTHDATDAFDSVEAREASTAAEIAFLLGPPDLRQVQEVCLSGETMPQKSTYFYPKLLTGLVFHPLTHDLAGAG